MPTTSLQKLHKAFQDHAKTEDRERRRHARRIYGLGEMLEEAGLYDEEDRAIKGMLNWCAEEMPKMKEKWVARGIKLSQPAKEEVRWPSRATFPKEVTLSKQARTALAATGLKEIRKADVKLGFGVAPDLQLWSGQVADYAVADSVVSELGGTLQRLGAAVAQLNEAAE